MFWNKSIVQASHNSYYILPSSGFLSDTTSENWENLFLLRKSHGQRSLVGCSPWGREESDTTEWLHFPFSLSGIGEGNGNPLQDSCLENPRDGEPGGLPSMGSHRVGHDWSNLAAAAYKGFLWEVMFNLWHKLLKCSCKYETIIFQTSLKRALYLNYLMWM